MASDETTRLTDKLRRHGVKKTKEWPPLDKWTALCAEHTQKELADKLNTTASSIRRQSRQYGVFCCQVCKQCQQKLPPERFRSYQARVCLGCRKDDRVRSNEAVPEVDAMERWYLTHGWSDLQGIHNRWVYEGRARYE